MPRTGQTVMSRPAAISAPRGRFDLMGGRHNESVSGDTSFVGGLLELGRFGSHIGLLASPEQPGFGRGSSRDRKLPRKESGTKVLVACRLRIMVGAPLRSEGLKHPSVGGICGGRLKWPRYPAVSVMAKRGKIF